jgi:hypothetical protein
MLRRHGGLKMSNKDLFDAVVVDDGETQPKKSRKKAAPKNTERELFVEEAVRAWAIRQVEIQAPCTPAGHTVEKVRAKAGNMYDAVYGGE